MKQVSETSMVGFKSALLLVVSVLIPSEAGSKQHSSRKPRHVPQDHAIVLPYKSDQDGNFISHDLRHNAHPHSRHKKWNLREQYNNIYYKVKSPHGDFHLDLEPNRKLLSPQFRVYKRNGTLRETRTLRSPLRQIARDGCLHHGWVKGQTQSSVALNLCDGLTGYIDTHQGTFLIQPLPHSMQSHRDSRNASLPQSAQPHQLYHHIDLNTNAAPEFCGHPGGPKSVQHNYTPNHTHQRPQRTRRSSPAQMENSAEVEHSTQMENSTQLENSTQVENSTEVENFTQVENVTHLESSTQLENSTMVKVSTSTPASSSTSSSSTSSSSSSSHRSSLDSRTVETLVVVDNHMLAQHGEANVTTYVLTILNMVSKLFHDNSIGSKINISLVALILLEGNEPGLQLGHHADESLSNFCQWQSTLEGIHHDHAILLTGVDICSYQDQPCDTLGFAPIHGMCKRFKSCTINEDTGLGTAFTIAHEAGHNLGMFHDGEGNYCSDLAGSIMAPTLLGHDGGFKWSACSRKYLHNFLRSGQAWCLEDESSAMPELRFPDKLPGEMYDVDTQCQWQFGPLATLCWLQVAKDLCKSLWCFTGGAKCETKFLPAAEGTSCGSGQWCRKGVCVKYGDDGPPPVDGAWSEFFNWTSCTRSCGGGVMYRQRRCNNPRPQYGGADCEGESRIYKLCNMGACPEQADFRQQQCVAYNDEEFRGWFYTWKPYTEFTDKNGRCRLYCQAEGYDFYFALSDRVTDGTSCEEGSPDVCVAGSCMIVGCDYIVDSGACLDSCGVCKGDNSTCTLVQGTLTQRLEPNAYHQILLLPRGARSILVSEDHISPSYLAVRSLNGTYALTGGWHVALPGDYPIAGTTFTYKRPYNKPETLHAPGPLMEDVVIELLVHGENPTINYQYTLPKMVDSPVSLHRHDNYSWTTIMSPCSESCAGGQKMTVAHCFRNLVEEVEETLCDVSTKPRTGLEDCNVQACPPRWKGQGWGSCSHSCGGGSRRRRVACMQRLSAAEEIRLRSRHCRHLTRPERRKPCNTKKCPARWQVGNWTQCSQSCDGGVQSRSVQCCSEYHAGVNVLPSSMCSRLLRPNDTAPCGNIHCPQELEWFLSSWNECSETCGLGIRERTLQCSGKDPSGKHQTFNDSFCRDLPRPDVSMVEECQNDSCKMDPRWFISPWSKCSVTCGQGEQTRMVKCMDEKEGALTISCSKALQPSTSKSCHAGACPQDTKCKDAYTWCDMVPDHDLCHHEFYERNCCAACKNSKP